MKTGSKVGLISSYFEFSNWILPIALAVFLVVLSFYNFLLFHTLAEFFAVTIAILMCVIAWNMYPFTRNHYLMYLGAGYFWIGMLDLMHTLNYKGMGIFSDGGANTAVQIWIGTRYLEALLLLSAPWFLKHSFNRNYGFVFFGFGAAFIILSVMSGLFPDGFIEGRGLTPFKIYSEYLIISLLAASIFYLIKQKSLLEPSIVRVMVVSIIFTMGAELAFTFYVSVYGLSNLAGHILKLFSFWLIFMAVIKTTLKEPFLAMSRSSSTYDAIPDATIVVDENGIVRQVNNKVYDLLDNKSELIIGKNNHDLFHPKNLNSDDCPVCKAIANNDELKGLELEFNEQGRWFDYSLSQIIGASDLNGTVEVIRDITQRKLTEDKVSELDVLKSSIVENLPNMLFVKDAKDLRYVEWNKAAEELTGLLKEDILGKNDFDFWPKEEAKFFISKDREVLNAGRSLEIEQESITTKNQGIRTLHTKKIPIVDKQGQTKYLLGMSEDITELLKTQEMLNRSQKMEVVGQMSGGIAHDFNNQLGVILGYTELLMAQHLSDEQSKWLAAVQQAADRCAELTRQLLVFSRNGEIDKQNLNANDLINEMKEMISRSLTPAVKVNYYLKEDLWETKVNKGSCQDAILNLVINAHDAMLNGGSLIIETNNIIFDQNIPSHINLLPGEYIQIMVSDSGDGMSKDVREHIFEPFYTTKDVGKGTGLGLSMVYSFVKRCGGDILLETEEGEGSTFRIYLPRSIELDSNIDKSLSDDVSATFPSGDESILIVDDEAALLYFGEEILKNWGYNVFCAENVESALTILNNNSIDLLFSDVVMPGETNGYALAEKALAINSNIKILLTSGFTDKEGSNTEYEKYNFHLIEKPYKQVILAEKLRTLLDE